MNGAAEKRHLDAHVEMVSLNPSDAIKATAIHGQSPWEESTIGCALGGQPFDHSDTSDIDTNHVCLSMLPLTCLGSIGG